ncbi:F-box protein SKIP19-like [Nicotiana tabacum]|uniref:F-box protein SKIP19-like n=1 Tax=Nicotiana tabacum TaxID=4097 RepID=A0AC58T936_TOBAC
MEVKGDLLPPGLNWEEIWTKIVEDLFENLRLRDEKSAVVEPELEYATQSLGVYLPEDIWVNILQRLSTIDKLRSAGKVCSVWRRLLREPVMWDVIDLRDQKCIPVFAKKDNIVPGKFCKNVSPKNVFQYLDDFETEEEKNEDALAIAAHLPSLRQLQLIGNTLTAQGLEAILEGCPNLKSLDLRRCLGIDLAQMVHFRHPNDSLIDFLFLV